MFFSQSHRVKGSVSRDFHDSNPSEPLINRLQYFWIRFRKNILSSWLRDVLPTAESNSTVSFTPRWGKKIEYLVEIESLIKGRQLHVTLPLIRSRDRVKAVCLLYSSSYYICVQYKSHAQVNAYRMVAVQILAPGLEPVEGEYQAQGYQASCTTGGGGTGWISNFP